MSAKKKIRTIAFDLGGVVFSQDNNIFSENYLEDTALTPGMYELLLQLSKVDCIKLIVISKAFPVNAKKSKAILKLYQLDDCFNSIIFCEDNKDKGRIAKAMSVDVMIDDKQEVLTHFDSDIQTILFQPSDVKNLYSRLTNFSS